MAENMYTEYEKNARVESILDLNSNNIWPLSESEVAELWNKERQEGDFSLYEEKLLNTIRLAFEVVHYNEQDQRQAERYENGEWACFTHCSAQKGKVAIRRKVISRITDLSYENVRHITAPMLLELIDRNFGGGWESLSLPIRNIIESGFDVSTTQLPASRIHAPGGTLEKKVAQGFGVLEIPKGSWVEAIFAKKKEDVSKMFFEGEEGRDMDEELLGRDDEKFAAKKRASFDDDSDDENEDENTYEEENEEVDDVSLDDETFYSSYSPEAEVKEELEDGFPMEE